MDSYNNSVKLINEVCIFDREVLHITDLLRDKRLGWNQTFDHEMYPLY